MAEYSEKAESVGGIVRRLEDNFINGTTHKSEFVDTSLYQDINKIEAYINSKHTSGSTDSLEREKPFANICIGARNIWYRATDIDRQNAKIKARKEKDIINSYVATAHIQDWMNRENFGQFLNIWGLNSATYNYAVTKFVEKDGRLIPVNVPWTRIICDEIDFDSNPKIEVLEFTEAQLRSNTNYNQEKVKQLCDAITTRKAIDGTEKNTNTGYIRLYEVHGEFSLATLKESKGEKCVQSDYSDFVQQMHVISFVAGKDNGTYEDFTLYSGREEDPYLLTWLIPSTDGSISLDGAVKNLFEAQWMLNHSAKAIKDQLDLASKILFQTSDANFTGQNALFALETGDILIHSLNQPLTQVNNASHDVSSLQNQGTFWKSLGNEINGISEAMLGIQPKAGTAWRQVEATLNESHDLFELMTQNKKLHMETMLRRFVIPHVKKKMDTVKELTATLSDYGIDKIETRHLKNWTIKQTNEIIKKRLLADKPKLEELPTPDMQQSMMQGIEMEGRQSLSEMGDTRFIKPSEIPTLTWKDTLKDLEWHVEVDIPGESSNSQDAMTTLNTIITMLANPNTAQFFETPRGKFLLNKALELTGTVSPIELAEMKSLPTSPAPIQPTSSGGSVSAPVGLSVNK